MQRARFNVIGLALLALGLASGCGSDGSTAKGDAGSDGGNGNGAVNQGSNANEGENNTNNTGTNANDGSNDPEDAGPKDGGPIDSGICTPMYSGCDDKYPGVDPATLCGEIDNGCGVMIDCDPEDDNCPGFGLACNDPAKPNQCGCKPKTCADVVAGGAQCGDDVEDACGGKIATSCGVCGARQICSGTPDYRCDCVPNNAACDGKVCGTASDGCNNTIACGAAAGACTVGTCSADQTVCACPTRDVACAGKPDGALTLNGCNYVCGACVANNAAACGTAECGTAVNNCGETINCGSSNGGCASGQACIDPTYVESATRKVCVDNDLANLVGTYGVRTHAFRHSISGGATSTDTYQRAQALSLVKITLKGAGRVPHLLDRGCSASSRNFPGDSTITSNAAPYENIAPVEMDLAVVGDAQGTGTWFRDFVETVVSPTKTTNGVPTGIILTMPEFCKGHEGAKATPTDGLARPWLTSVDPTDATKKQCKCPATLQAAETMPASSAVVPSDANSLAQDCRIIDADADNQPGFTVTATASGISLTVYNISISGVQWKGSIRPDGYHTGVAIEPNPIDRSVAGCAAAFLCGTVAAKPAADCGCGDLNSGEYNYVQFAPLDGLTKAADTWTCADVRNNADAGTSPLFKQSFGTCTGSPRTSAFPTGTVCSADSKLYPASGVGSCTATAQCPLGTECKGNSCWPQKTQCVAEATCKDPPAPTP